ncbi:type II toxin-antitoxin system MqsA family antitoxin [Candidatus Obscuribacterales bacterium]|nr:type II toxin-antitoxin system MqsA family antitoxin [Candidatus Obscuribacterales bacterium]
MRSRKSEWCNCRSGFIGDTRKKLRLDQREAAGIFGGGPNAFSRYENGKTRTPLSLVQLFKLLDKHPELLDEIREKKNLQASTQETTPARIARRKRSYA